MKNQRRLFLNQLSVIAGIAAINKPFASIASVSKRIYTLHSAGHAVTIYHTNNLHGKMESVYNNMGGINQVKTLIEKQDTSGLLFDAGDFLNSRQNNPEHKNMIGTMNSMGYCAATPGNNELIHGQQYLAALIPLMKFELVNCNYQFDAALSGLIKPYIIINTGKFKVGITGVGKPVYGVVYNDAIKCANQTARLLREKENCDLVICLSHLGYEQKGNAPDNKKLAQQSENIDLIIGDHNNKLIKGPQVIRNAAKNEVILSQTGWDGLLMGKTVFDFENGRQKHGITAKHLIPGQPYDQTFGQSLATLRLKENAA